MHRFSLTTIIVLFCLTLLAPVAAQTAPAKGTEILWDTWGVAHIFADDNASAFYAFGWAQMQNHADLILNLYGRARGEAAQYWGEAFVENDMLMHTLDVPGIAQAHYAAQHEPFKSYLDAFVAGMNAYAEAHPDAISDSVEAVLPVRNTDPLALAYNDIVITFVAGDAVGLSQQWQAGSNAWAIAPSRSESGNTLMVLNPHVLWSDLFTWFEAQIVTPDVNLYGGALVGLPGIVVGFNDHHGWTHTVNIHDGFDLYELTLTESGGYMLDGQETTFEATETTIQVKRTDGKVETLTFQVMRSVHGPVVAYKGRDRALAVRIVNDTTHLMEQWWKMGTATDLEAFEAAMSMLQLPTFNTVYGDTDGHIYYVFNGQIPVREQGDFESWLPIHNGDVSSLIWTETHPYEDLPKVMDPETGFVQSANDVPWTSTLPPALDMSDFPAYFSAQEYIFGTHFFRPISSLQMLAEDESISFDELLAYKHSTHVEMADHVLDDLIAAARAEDSESLNEAADVLEAWDRQTNADSKGAILFMMWAQNYLNRNGMDIFATPFDINQPFSTPSGLVDPDEAVAVLLSTIGPMKAHYGSLDVAYGDVMRLRVGEYDLPGNGGGDPLGIFRSTWYSETEDGTFFAAGGDSWVAVLEFSQPLRAKVLVSQGNATQPGSPHVGDQLELYAAKELRDAWRTREEIEANLEDRTTFE